MLKLQIPREMLDELQKRADDFGFKTPEEFTRYVLKELLEAIRSKNFTSESSENSEKEQEIMRARLQDLGYM